MNSATTLGACPIVDDDPPYGEIACERTIDDLFKRYGTESNSLILQQPGVGYWGDRNGMVGYTTVRTLFSRQIMVFANPLCAPERYESLLTAFLAAMPDALFVSVDEAVCRVLNRLGYRSNHFGWDNTIHLSGFDTAGSKKKQLRNTGNRWTKAGSVVVEQTWDEVDATAVRLLSDAWRKTKTVSTREINLFTRPPGFCDEAGVRKFYCYDRGQLIGFVFFLPIYNDGRVIGYGSNITRALPTANHGGVTDFIILEAIKKFRSEGLTVLSLGISPLHQLERTPNESPFIRHVLSWSFHSLDRFYAFQGLANHKKKYRARGQKWFLCTRRGMGKIKIAYCLAFASKVFDFGLAER